MKQYVQPFKNKMEHIAWMDKNCNICNQGITCETEPKVVEAYSTTYIDVEEARKIGMQRFIDSQMKYNSSCQFVDKCRMFNGAKYVEPGKQNDQLKLF